MPIPKQGPVIAIDGPAGTGKSTVTQALCKKLGYVHVDTGALYRSVALSAKNADLLPSGSLSQSNKEAISEMTRNLHIEFKRDESKAPPNRVWVNSNDVTDDIRSAEVSMEASKVSSIPEVRAALLGFQRRLGCVGKTVLEGRDIGTIIFPDADLKLFLTASSEERAKRRLKDLAASGKPHPNLDELKVQIEKRDSDDSSRKVAPLKKASDAVELDTTNLNLDEVVEKAYQAAKAKGL